MATMSIIDPTARGTSDRPGMCFRSKCCAPLAICPSPILPVCDPEPLSVGPVPPHFSDSCLPFAHSELLCDFLLGLASGRIGPSTASCGCIAFSLLSLLSEPHTQPLQ